MANYSVWNVRKRHEWLATPLKKKRIKMRAAKRIGLADVWARTKKDEPVEEEATAEGEAPAADAPAETKAEA